MDILKYMQNELAALAFRYQFDALTVPRERWTERPDPGNSVAWVAWHITRNQDVVINAIIQEKPQVFRSDAWPERLRYSDIRIGTGFGVDDVDAFNASINVDELDAYWHAVQDSTRTWLDSLELADLDRVVDADGLEGRAGKVWGTANWVLDIWRGRSVGDHFNFFVVSHANQHYGAIQTIAARLGIKLL
jgi:hypothetical protein